MPYGLILLVISIALALWYVLATEASLISKASVSCLQCFALICYHLLPRFSLYALFLMAGVGIFILFYRACQQVRPSDEKNQH